jgi:putative peptidoglycan lipid II flippase
VTASNAADASSGGAEQKKISARAGIVAAGTLASRLLGLGRDVSMAAMFSVAHTDAFWIAFTLPNALRQLLAEGAVSGAVVPVLSAVQEKEGDGAARAFYARIRGLSLAALGLVSVAGVLGAPWLVELFAGGLRERPEQLDRTVTLTRIVFPYIFFMGTAALGMAALHTSGRFVAASFAPALLNVALIAACFGLPPLLGAAGQDASIALGIGALVGGALQVVAQWPSLRAAGYQVRPRFDLEDRRVREVLRRIAPMTLGLGIYYIDLVVCRRLLSGQGEGAQSYFSWAQRLCDFPQGIFVMALQTAALPSLARYAAADDHEGLGATFAFGMRMALFVALPVTALFLALSEPIVVAAFQRGQFTARDAYQTGLALAGQGAGLWTVAAVRQLVSVFFALGDTRTPVLVSALDLLALILLAYSLTPVLGHVGVSIAVSGSSFVQMLLLWLLLWRRLRVLRTGEILRSGARTLLASLVGAAGAWGAAALASSVGQGPFERLLPALAGGAAFVVLFVALAWALGSDELAVLGGGLARKLRRLRPAPRR